MMFNVPDHSPI